MECFLGPMLRSPHSRTHTLECGGLHEGLATEVLAMSVWDGILLAVAAFIAVTSLVRLMIARRNEMLSRLRNEKLAEQARQTETS